MAFEEDLSQFFDTADGFAVAATIQNATGTFVRTADVIFNTPSQSLQIFSPEAMVNSPNVLAKSVDVQDVRDGWRMVINSTTYRVSGAPEHDGTGVATVQLKPL